MGIYWMAETISDLLWGVCGMLLAGEIVSVVGKEQHHSTQHDLAQTLHLSISYFHFNNKNFYNFYNFCIIYIIFQKDNKSS